MIKFPDNKTLIFKELIELFDFDYEILGKNENLFITNISTIENADENSLVFIGSQTIDKFDKLNKTKAKIIFCDLFDFNILDLPKDKILIIINEPKVKYSKIVNIIFNKDFKYEIHPTTVIHPEAKISKNVYIGPFCYIGKCIIKEGTIIEGHVYISDNVQINKNVKIQAGSKIGIEGYDHILDKYGNYIENFPQLGGIIIEDRVLIGANSVIQRGSLNNTIIKKNTIIDNQVTIAHNVIIDENTLILGHSHVGGSVKIGNNVFIGQSSSIANVGYIGNHSKIGIGSIVIRKIDEFTSVFGNPASKTISPK